MSKKILIILAIIVVTAIGYFRYSKLNNQNNNVDIYEDGNSQVNIYEENTKTEEVVEEEIVEEKIPISYTAAVPIYMYHWIKDDTGDYPWPENMVKIGAIKEQVEYLVNNDYDLIWITDLEKIYNYEKPVALTFDDGWHDVYLHMFPLAKEYKIKFSMYVIKDMVGKPGYCTEEQLKEMQDSGLVDIQSHTVTHPYLAQLSYDRQKSELFDSKEYLKDVYNIDSTVICYPSGSRNESTVEISKEAGYTYGLDMDGGVYYTNVHTNPYKIPRIYAMRSMSLNTFASYAKQAKVEVVWEEE